MGFWPLRLRPRMRLFWWCCCPFLMVRPFAVPFRCGGIRLASPSAPQTRPQEYPYPPRQRRGQDRVGVGPKRIVEMRRVSPQRQVPCCEAPTPGPQPLLRCCPPLIMRVVASMTNRGTCRNDEASRPQDLDLKCADRPPAHPVFGAARLTRLSEALLRATAPGFRSRPPQRPSGARLMSRVDSVRKT